MAQEVRAVFWWVAGSIPPWACQSVLELVPCMAANHRRCVCVCMYMIGWMRKHPLYSAFKGPSHFKVNCFESIMFLRINQREKGKMVHDSVECLFDCSAGPSRFCPYDVVLAPTHQAEQNILSTISNK